MMPSMRTGLRSALLGASLLGLSLDASAEPVSGFYVAGGIGVNWGSNVSHTIPASATDPFNGTGPGGQFLLFVPSTLSGSSDTGWAALGSFGWGFGNGLRVEIEGHHRSNDAHGVRYDIAGLPITASRGTFTSAGLMVNALYDFQVGGIMPYLGAGVGYASHSLDISSTSSGLEARLSGTDGQLAYQGIAGVAIPITSAPGLALTAEYRYLASIDARMNGSVTAAVNGAVGSFSAHVPNDNHSILLGLRYNFGR